MKPTTPITLDKERHLFYGMAAIKLIENAIGKSLSDIPMGNGMTAEHKAIFLWAGLYHEDNSLTPERVIELVDEYSNYYEAIDTMNRAILESYGPPSKNSQRAAKGPGTGKN